MTPITKELLLANGFWCRDHKYGNGIVNLYWKTDACGRPYLQGTFHYLGNEYIWECNLSSMELLQQFLDAIAPHCSESDQKHLKLKF